MSAYIFGRVLYHPDLTTAQKITLAAIADVVNDHGFGWMLISTLCLKTSLSERGVQKALSELIDMGLLKRRVRRDRCSQFLIVVDALPLKPKPDDREADLPEGWGAQDAPPRGAPGAGGGAPGAGGGAPGAPITLTEPGRETDSPLYFVEGTPTGQETLFGEVVAAPEIALADRVLEEWHRLAKEVQGIADVRVLDADRRKKIETRAGIFKKVDADGWRVWQQVFAAIRSSTYLRGEDPPGKGYTEPFRLRLDYVLRRDEFVKMYEGGYRANRNSSTHDPASGRRYGPAEQAGRDAVARLRNSDAQRGDGQHDRGGAEAHGSASDRPRRLRSAFDQHGVDPR